MSDHGSGTAKTPDSREIDDTRDARRTRDLKSTKHLDVMLYYSLDVGALFDETEQDSGKGRR